MFSRTEWPRTLLAPDPRCLHPRGRGGGRHGKGPVLTLAYVGSVGVGADRQLVWRMREGGDCRPKRTSARFLPARTAGCVAECGAGPKVAGGVGAAAERRGATTPGSRPHPMSSVGPSGFQRVRCRLPRLLCGQGRAVTTRNAARKVPACGARGAGERRWAPTHPPRLAGLCHTTLPGRPQLPSPGASRMGVMPRVHHTIPNTQHLALPPTRTTRTSPLMQAPA